MFAGPIYIFGSKIKRDDKTGVRLENIAAARTIGELIRTNLGPTAMLKMLMDPMGGVVMTSDGNAILREIVVKHPVAKMLVEIARTQDEEVGDGTKSVVILSAEILNEVENYLSYVHPTVIIRELRKALDDILSALKGMSKTIDTGNVDEVMRITKSCLATKYLGACLSDMLCNVAIRAVGHVRETFVGKERIDIKSYVRVEKIMGGTLEDTEVVEGVVLNKDTLHPDMRRTIANPRIVLLSCGLEYRKGESPTTVELTKEGDFTRMLQIEEETICNMCRCITAVKPDLVVAEKGISDIAIHYLVKAGVSALRRVKKMDVIRLSRVSGASVVGRVEEINEKDVGTRAGKFEIKLIGDEYFAFINDCSPIKACTILLRGPSKDILNEVERNLQDAMNVIRNIYREPEIVPGGGATEMRLCCELMQAKLGTIDSPYNAVPLALKIIPLTLIQNTGCSTLRVMSDMELAHAKGEVLAVDGTSGQLVPFEKLGVWESTRVKGQIYKTAVETAIQILKIDEIVSGTKSKEKEQQKVAREERDKKKVQQGQGDNPEY